MGQAAVDLPKSPETAPAPIGNADDLLSQLAGQEIDRLLAEAEEKPGADAPPPESTDMPAPTEAELKELLAPAKLDELSPRNIDVPPATDEAPKPAPAEEAATAAPAADETSKTNADPGAAATGTEPYAAEIDDVFKNIESAGGPGMKFPNTEPDPPSSEPDTQTSTAEREALNPEPEAELEIDLNAPVRKTPIYVRLLELINAPVDACPDALRDTLGKIAILTTMNALGILLYLLMFKR